MKRYFTLLNQYKKPPYDLYINRMWCIPYVERNTYKLKTQSVSGVYFYDDIIENIEYKDYYIPPLCKYYMQVNSKVDVLDKVYKFGIQAYLLDNFTVELIIPIYE